MNKENQIVYRYMSMKGIIPTLQKHALRAATPKDFHDPHEFKYRHVDITKEQAKEKLEELKRQASPEYKSLKNIIDNDEKLIDEIMRMSKDSQGVDIRSKLQDNFRICCFTRKNDNEYMWKEYADNYRGAVLEFFFHKRERAIHPIDYSDELPPYNPAAPFNPEVFKKIILHKEKEPYQKEEELRQIVPYGKKEREKLKNGSKSDRDFLDSDNELNIGFDPRELIGVYIGDEASKEDIKKIIELLKNDIYSHVKVYQLIRCGNSTISFSLVNLELLQKKRSSSVAAVFAPHIEPAELVEESEG